MFVIQALAIAVLILAFAIALSYFGVDLPGLARERLHGRGTGTQVLPEQLQPIHQRLEELTEHIGAVRELAETRGKEVERLREGRDFAATRGFARGVIKAVDLLQDFQAQLSEAYSDDESPILKDALRRLEAAECQLTLLLEANRIEPFSPEPGESVLEDSRRFEPLESFPAQAEEDIGRVKSVSHPGYVLVQGESETVVIREAQVTVFGPAPVQEGSPS